METDQAEQVDVLLNQSIKVLNKNHDTEETDASTTLKWDNRSPLPSPFDSKEIQKEIVMAKKRDTNSITFGQQLKSQGLVNPLLSHKRYLPLI